MSVIIWLFLVSFLCVGISAGEGCFGYELLVERLENLENRLTNLLATSQNVFNEKINELSKNIAAGNLRISADSVKNQNAINEKISTITSKINDQNSRLEKIESMGKAVVKMLEQSHSGIETKHSRLTERLTTLETTGDAILSRQRSTEGRINELTAGISTLGNQSRQILKNHNDLVVASCDMPTISGIYRLQVPNMNVFCDAVDGGGRWLYIQRRVEQDVISFDRN
ncbi:angiopoietin-4 [Culex quinquefasciatus]|uniref:angiopoietin-4 n=1 Tax=Culex quinquefasciatus TaxID=7176 RepID=UPI0018E3CEE8|nr:angiopoietin-4 [Culex quinquefasciatus]